jgi:hypothetical protein
MNREALIQTVRVLKDVQKWNLAFDLTSFVGRSVGGENYSLSRYHTVDEVATASEKFTAAMEKEQFILIPHNCGCTACATGYAGLDPWFQQQGFCTTPDGRVEYRRPSGTVNPNWYGMTEFYDLEQHEAQYLFMPHCDYRTAQDVIDRIEDVLRDGFPDWDSEED